MRRSVRGVRLLADGDGGTVDAIVQSARADAHAAGVLDGRAMERASGAALLDQVVQEVQAAQERALAELTQGSIKLAISITRALLKREIRAGNYDVEAIVREALAEAGSDRSRCIVHLNPLDSARLEGTVFRTGTVIQADDGVAQGDVHVETAMGLLVRETRDSLASIEQRLHEELL